MSNVKSFKAQNDSIFLIELYSPFPGFLGLLSMQYCSVVPKEIVESTDFHSNPIGTGPFKFQMWQKGEKLIFRKNQNIKFQFDMFHGNGVLDKAISVLDPKDRSDFKDYVNSNCSYNQDDCY